MPAAAPVTSTLHPGQSGEPRLQAIPGAEQRPELVRDVVAAPEPDLVVRLDVPDQSFQGDEPRGPADDLRVHGEQ